MLKNIIVSMFVLTMAGCHTDTTVQSDVVNPQITDAVTQAAGTTVTVEASTTSQSSNVTCANGATPVDGVCPDAVTGSQTSTTVTETPASH